MEERPPVPPDGASGSAKDAAAGAASSSQGEVQDLFAIDLWGAVFIVIMLLLGLMQGATCVHDSINVTSYGLSTAVNNAV